MIDGLKMLFKSIADRFPRRVVKKLEAFPESSNGGWSIAVKTKDGRIFREVEVGYGFMGIGHFVHIFGDEKTWNKLPFRLHDVVDIEWEGYRLGKTTQRPEPARPEWKFYTAPL